MAGSDEAMPRLVAGLVAGQIAGLLVKDGICDNDSPHVQVWQGLVSPMVPFNWTSTPPITLMGGVAPPPMAAAQWSRSTSSTWRGRHCWTSTCVMAPMCTHLFPNWSTLWYSLQRQGQAEVLVE